MNNRLNINETFFTARFVSSSCNSFDYISSIVVNKTIVHEQDGVEAASTAAIRSFNSVPVVVSVVLASETSIAPKVFT